MERLLLVKHLPGQGGERLVHPPARQCGGELRRGARGAQRFLSPPQQGAVPPDGGPGARLGVAGNLQV